MEAEIDVEETIEKALQGIGKEYGIEFQPANHLAAYTYEVGEWLYEIWRFKLVLIYRWSIASDRLETTFIHDEDVVKLRMDLRNLIERLLAITS